MCNDYIIYLYRGLRSHNCQKPQPQPQLSRLFRKLALQRNKYTNNKRNNRKTYKELHWQMFLSDRQINKEAQNQTCFVKLIRVGPSA